MCFVSVDRRVISDVTVTPHDDRTLLVQWRSLVSSSLTGFVVEWRPLLKTDLSLTRFEITDKNQTSLAITGMLYSICIAGFRFLRFFFHVLLILLAFYLVFLIRSSSFTTRIHSYARSSFSCARPAGISLL